MKLALTIGLISIFYLSGFGASVFSSTSNQSTTSSPIQHLVIIMKENHSFDNYFGTYPNVTSGFASNVCVQQKDGCFYPFDLNKRSPDMTHSFNSAYSDWNKGKMNNFHQTEGRNTFGYYDNNTISDYWLYAKSYVLDDEFFSSVFGYSLPNHWLAVSGAVPKSAVDRLLIKDLPTYLQEAQGITTIADVLNGSPVTWKYYHQALGNNYTTAVENAEHGCVGNAHPNACNLWNPFMSQKRSYSESYSPHFVANSRIFFDIAKGDLPNVSYVIPDGGVSEHAPNSIEKGMDWTADVVNAVMKSNYWSSTAIIVSWDDYGGFYDAVAPPKLIHQSECIPLFKTKTLNPDCYLGFRVPSLIISPYSKHGYIDHTQYSFESILKFIEWNWGFSYSNARIQYANNIQSSFNFSIRYANPPTIIPMNSSYAASLISGGDPANGSPDVD